MKTDEAPGYKDTLRCLKIWPRYRPALSSEGPSYIAAIDALLCADGAMFVPWIANANRFIDPVSVSAYANTLGMLGCTVMPVGSIWAYVKEGLPRELTSNQLQAYLKCIECLAAHDCKPTSIQAPNGFGVMCDPSALFDHKDDTFRGVFRKSEEVHFLHPLFRSQRTYWLNLGLRTKSNVGEMRWKDFLECLTTMVQRLRLQSNNSLEDVQDAEKVTAYLRYPHPDSQYWPNNAWNTITQAKIYRAQNNLSSEPTYRQAQMLQIANKPGPYSIDYAAPRNQMRILWSQRPLLSDPPASAVYEKLPDGGRPEPRLVYQHLQHLISIRNEVNDSELSDYLKDVQATYAYLQERREESASIPAIREARVWLNLPTTDLNSVSSSQLEGALRSAKNLCFNTPLDTHVMERAKNFLIPYESLLRALGCHVMVRPPKQAVAPRSNQHRPIDQILAVIRNMREQGQLSDVTFEAEGVKVPANRNFMAAVSELWRNRFLREWSRGLGAKPNIEVGISMKTSLKTLQYIVDFAYTGVVKWPQLQDVENIKEVADTLDELLDLLQGANSWFMATLHDLTERQLLDMSEVLLRPDNVERIMEEAEIGKAERLVKHCREFIAANKLIVEDCKAMEQDQDGDIFDDIT